MLKFLNDDCLLEIFEYLDVRDQLNLALLDERFRPLIVERTWRKFHIFHFHNFPTLMLTSREYQKLFYLVAPQITELSLEENMEPFCPNYDCYYCIEYPQLRKLYLKGDDFPDNYFMRLARNCPKLELLDVYCSSVTCESLCQFPNLQTFSLKSDDLEPIYLEKVFEKQKITHVQLGIVPTNIKGFNKVLKTIFPKITKLRYFDNYEGWGIGNLFNSSAHLFQNLEVLHVLDCKERSFDFVCSLHTLRVLCLKYYNLENGIIPMKDLLKVIENNVHLEHINLYRPLECRNNWNLEVKRITGEGVCKLSDLRRQQQKNEQSKRLLNIHVPDSLVKDLQHFVKDHDSNHGYQEPAIKIERFSAEYSMEFDAFEYSLDFMLNWN